LGGWAVVFQNKGVKKRRECKERVFYILVLQSPFLFIKSKVADP
jgi:hypothetical protein